MINNALNRCWWFSKDFNKEILTNSEADVYVVFIQKKNED